MTAPAPIWPIIRWDKPELPGTMGLLLAEAIAGGYVWMNRFVPEWTQRPYLDTGEGLYLAMDGTTPIAMAVMSFDRLAGEPDTGRLRFIYVSKSARRQGLAERMVQACIGIAGDRWKRITLHTDNPVAAALYARYGFVPTADSPRNSHHVFRP